MVLTEEQQARVEANLGLVGLHLSRQVDVPAQPRRDIEAEVARYRAAGVDLPDATAGTLPGSVVTWIQPERTFGLSIQLIAFSG